MKIYIGLHCYLSVLIVVVIFQSLGSSKGKEYSIISGISYM